MRVFGQVVRMAGIVLVGVGCGVAPKPDVVLITVDTLRADRLGCYGYDAARTPTMDGWAASGLRVEHAVACIPRTTQAVASLFTGRYPAEHGVREIGEYLTLGETTWAEVFEAQGYATCGISANQVAGSFQGLHQGFQEFTDASDLRREHPELALDGGDRFGFAEAVTEKALDWMGRDRDRPYFLWLHYIDPHFPYRPPPQYRAGADTSGLGFYAESDGFEARSATISFDLNGRSSDVLESMKSLYDAEIAYVDAMLAKIDSALALSEEPPLVLLTADHGESLGDHGYFYEHGDFVFDASMRIPLIVRWPGQLGPGRIVDEPVSLVDLLPTICGLLGMPLGPVSGEDLSAEWSGEGSLPRRVYGESGSALRFQNPYRSMGGRRRPGPLGQESFRYARDGDWIAMGPFDSDEVRLFDATEGVVPRIDRSEQAPEVKRRLVRALSDVEFIEDRSRMVREDRWKLVATPRLDRVEWVLYDLELDPSESVDVSVEHPEVAARLRSALDAWWMDTETVPAPAAPGGLDAERIDRDLRSLGYID